MSDVFQQRFGRILASFESSTENIYYTLRGAEPIAARVILPYHAPRSRVQTDRQSLRQTLYYANYHTWSDVR